MRIALLAPLWKKVPPEKYGGSEFIVANLAKGLTDLGHSVTTFACAGSNVSGELVSVIQKPMYDLVGGFDWNGVKQYEFLSFFDLGKRIRDFDVVHNHMGLHPVSLAPLIQIPFVTTLHSSLPPDFPYLAEAFREYPFVSISDAQRRLAPDLNYVATVYHGIDVKSFDPNIGDVADKFIFIGTLSKNKGVDLAVRCALELKIDLTIAGEVRDADKPFLEKEVFPFVDGKHIRFVGEIGHKDKAYLLANSSALLFPSRWNEAFGLVMAEALACGTPVVALNNGAVSEILRHAETGLVANNEKQFISCAKRVKEMSRQKCRKEAEERFDISSMASGYERVFSSLVKKI